MSEKNKLKISLFIITLFFCIKIDAQNIKVSHFPGKNPDGTFTNEWVKVSTYENCIQAVNVENSGKVSHPCRNKVSIVSQVLKIDSFVV